MDYTFTNWFYGNEISDYGKKNKRVDYRAFAKSFEGVLANQLMSQTDGIIGYWEQISGTYYEDTKGNQYSPDEVDEVVKELEEKVDELQEMLNDIEQLMEQEDDDKKYDALEKDYKGTEKTMEDIQDNIDALEEPYYPEVFQWFIIDYNGVQICEEYNEIVYFNGEMDLYLWGVTHFGTAWDYVLTNIPCEPTED